MRLAGATLFVPQGGCPGSGCSVCEVCVKVDWNGSSPPVLLKLCSAVQKGLLPLWLNKQHRAGTWVPCPVCCVV